VSIKQDKQMSVKEVVVMRRLGEGCLFWVLVLLLLLLFPSVVLVIVNEALHLLAVVLARLLELASHAGSGSGSGSGTSPPVTTVLAVGGSGSAAGAGAGSGAVIRHG